MHFFYFQGTILNDMRNNFNSKIQNSTYGNELNLYSSVSNKYAEKCELTLQKLIVSFSMTTT